MSSQPRRRMDTRSGLPVDPRQRRLKVDRSRGRGGLTQRIPGKLQLQRRIEPAVSGEESEWLLQDRAAVFLTVCQ